MIDENIIFVNNLDVGEQSNICDEESTSSESTNGTTPFYEKMTEEDHYELVSSVYELIDEYMKTEIIKISKPEFHKELVDDIVHILFQGLCDAEVCNDHDYTSFHEFIEYHCNEWFENKIDFDYPLRTLTHYNANFHCNIFGMSPDVVLHDLTNRINYLRKINEESPKQRTPEWYQRRYNMMTASNLWQCLNTDSQRNRLIFEKCKPLDFGYTENKWISTENSLHWGVKYEPLTAMIYQNITGAKIEDYGCIPHDCYPFIGASPDGIVVNPESPLYGRMLEIKNIYNRDMDGIPSEAYWIQMQIQMECCNLDVCDFVETRFKEYALESDFNEETDNTCMRGVILHFVQKDSTSNVPLYKYMPLDIHVNDQNAIGVWIEQCKSELPEWAIYKNIYWYLDEICMSTIIRNKSWFQAALPKIKETWSIIESERVSGYQHRAAKKRIANSNDIIVIKSAINSTDGPESHIIRNMPSNNKGVCLIKIDNDES